VGLVNKLIDAIAKAEKTFMVLPFMLISDLRIKSEKGRQERGCCVRVLKAHRQQWDESSHLFQRNRGRSPVVEENCIVLNQRVSRRIERERNIHDCTRQKHVHVKVNALDSRTGRVFFLKGRVIAAEEAAEESAVVT
jgi:hypothetical protein